MRRSVRKPLVAETTWPISSSTGELPFMIPLTSPSRAMRMATATASCELSACVIAKALRSTPPASAASRIARSRADQNRDYGTLLRRRSSAGKRFCVDWIDDRRDDRRKLAGLDAPHDVPKALLLVVEMDLGKVDFGAPYFSFGAITSAVPETTTSPSWFTHSVSRITLPFRHPSLWPSP